MSSAPEPLARGGNAPDGERGAGLAADLRAAGVPARVESVGSLAVITADAAADVDWPRVRRDLVDLARRHGFTHLALEVDGSARPAPRPADEPR